MIITKASQVDQLVDRPAFNRMVAGSSPVLGIPFIFLGSSLLVKANSMDLDTARQCPWCQRFALKDAACNWVCCGLAVDGFKPGCGCGRQWCFQCEKRLCGQVYDPDTGAQMTPAVSTSHNAACCEEERARLFSGALNPDELYCPGGHNSHR